MLTTILPLLLTTLLSFTTASALPNTNTLSARQVPPFTPGTLNNTQEFYIALHAKNGLKKYNGWQVETYHTGAGIADPVFTNATGTPAFLNGTNLQFDVGVYPFAAQGFPSDTNYARWEPVSIASGYGTGEWTIDEYGDLVIDNSEFDGWIICEWFHGDDLPQLFQLITGFDGDLQHGAAGTLPKSCARVTLTLDYF